MNLWFGHFKNKEKFSMHSNSLYTAQIQIMYIDIEWDFPLTLD